MRMKTTSASLLFEIIVFYLFFGKYIYCSIHKFWNPSKNTLTSNGGKNRYPFIKFLLFSDFQLKTIKNFSRLFVHKTL